MCARAIEYQIERPLQPPVRADKPRFGEVFDAGDFEPQVQFCALRSHGVVEDCKQSAAVDAEPERSRCDVVVPQIHYGSAANSAAIQPLHRCAPG